MKYLNKEVPEEIKIKVQIVIYSVIALMVSGTILFHFLEGWSYIDSFYFLSVTITTIGYGDLCPTTDLTKILTVIYSFAGIGIILLVAQTFTKAYIEKRYNHLQSKRNHDNHK